MVQVGDKKEFIRMLLNTVQFKRRESVWILNYLMSHDKLIKNVQFVEFAQFCPRGIIISSHCSDDIPFRFYEKGIMSTDAERSFHVIRKDTEEPIYIQINYDKKASFPLWKRHLSVLVENDHAPKTTAYESKADHILQYSLREGERKRLMDEIDGAIKEGNKHKFMELTEKLKNTPTLPKNFITVKGTMV